MRSYCRECGVYLCLRPGHNCFRLYHSKTSRVAISTREFVAARKATKPDFMCFVKEDANK